METCPRCHQSVAPAAIFCPRCGTQLQVQPVEGDVVDQDNHRSDQRPIDPRRAAGLSIVPGLGHWYAGAPLKGIAFFAAVVGPLVLGTDLDLTVVGAIAGIPLDIGGLGLWGFCAYDAYRTAKRRMAPGL